MNWLKSKTVWFGGLLALVPQFLDLVSKVDWAAWGISPNVATIIGAAVVLLRSVTTQPLSEK